MYAVRDVSRLGTVMAVFTSAQDFCFKQLIKKIRINSKPYVPRALRFSCQGPSRLRESGKGYGDESGEGERSQANENYHPHITPQQKTLLFKSFDGIFRTNTQNDI